ncbi:DUF1269 domain-containing protein [Salinadaptatus halalkaliphilus]|uniref:DUF1269 domain-containing protein n=1 Tax=Salinadaptatus halalkaliphilus TaxID=2419781 RepID=A0A4S3TIW0_9EURY|nr:DUF1269 domain-containing protein [Salinadaptatus halalkaliphilus]THE62795.1 DUF1269 domain-containing protein [Salinadaptatus halalkaliphilus]
MKELIVLAFDSMDGAGELRDDLYDLQKQELLQLDDAAVVVRDEGGHARVKHANSLVGSGALAGEFANVGIDDDFIDEVADTIEPGHSAVFMLAHEVSQDRVVEDLAPYDPEVIRTNRSPDKEDTRRETFAAEEVPA